LKEYDDHHDSGGYCHWATALTLVIAGAGWLLTAIRPVYQSYQQMQQFTADAAHEPALHRLYSRHRRICPDVDNLSNEEMQETAWSIVKTID